MQRRKLTLSLAVAGLVTLAAVGSVAGQDPEDANGQLPATETRTGTIEAVTDADGDITYQLTDANGTVPLSVGPPWFWGDSHPLHPFVGDEVTVFGELDDGTPPAHANARNRADGLPSFDVFAVDDETIRTAGKPPWAGGPKAVGESHPGYAGWSRGQAARDAGADNADSAP